MPVLFPSREWAQKVVELTNDSPEFANNVKMHNEAMTLNIQSEEGLLEETFVLWLNVANKKIEEFRILTSPDEREAVFKLKAKYSVWKKVFSGEINPTMALVTKRIRVSGNLKDLLNNKKAYDVVINHMLNMDITYVS